MKDEIWRDVCQFHSTLIVFLSINLVLTILLLISFPFLERGSGSYVVALMSTVVIGASSAAFLFLLYRCRKAGLTEDTVT